MTKEQPKKQKKLKKNAKQLEVGIEAEPTCTSKGASKPKTKGIQAKGNCATEGATEEKTAKKFKASHEPLGKRAGNPNPSHNKQDLKKKKLEDSKTQDVAEAGSFKENSVASKKKKKLEDSKTQDVAEAGASKEISVASKKKKMKQEPEAFNAPKSPPTTSKGKASASPTTPKGIPPQRINPIYTPARPKGVSRVIKDDDSEWESEDNESVTDSSTEDDSEDSAEDSL